MIHHDTIQFYAIQYDTIQYYTIQYYTIQYNTIQYNTILYNTIQYNTIQYNTIQYNTIKDDKIKYNTIQYNMTSRYSDVSSSRFQIKVTVSRYQTMNMIINYHYCLEMRNDFMMASLISRPQTHFPPPPTLSTTIFSALHSPSLLPFPLFFPYLLFIAQIGRAHV